ncbi:MAG: hypothetical protein Q8R67_24715 [Rhodoferax sp.]|nr:hypothetical protein [Rhodoferax sp.]MDP3654876.1 hypothetical protein [Rhodoferax sp.]
MWLLVRDWIAQAVVRRPGPIRPSMLPEYGQMLNTLETQRKPGGKPLSGGFDVQFFEQIWFIERFWRLWTLS